ncbi:MAG: hypothetical protein JWO91_1236, partial [Acidobacteriaceae bacterium]|nr:hypothetical protein [Acidobacteriaceae bacterium]MCU1296958.1 hypothetical protein [Acidobacteriaceae bacterium]
VSQSSICHWVCRGLLLQEMQAALVVVDLN